MGIKPRPEGAISGDGNVVGSVSGGCVENDLGAKVGEQGISHRMPEIVTYDITAEEAHRFGLPCGGTIQLAIEPLSAQSRIPELLERLAQHPPKQSQKRKSTCAMITMLNCVGQGGAIGACFNTSFGIFIDINVLTDKLPGYCSIGQKIRRFIVLQGQVMGNTSWSTHRKYELHVFV